MKVAAFLPAKGHSERVKNKNLRLLDGKPLFLHTLEKLLACDFIDEVYLDTESQAMIDMAAYTGCHVLKRDPSLASNQTDGHQLFYNEVKHCDADIVIQILGTSPFIAPSTIEKAVLVLKNQPEYDSCVLVRHEKQYLWQDNQPSYPIEKIPNSVDLPQTTIETMGLYVMRAEAAKRLQRRIGESPYLLSATPLEAIDVNWAEDVYLAELIAAGKREKSRALMANLARLLNSSLLSDILDDLGYPDQVVSGLCVNFDSTRVIGRAKTLKLRKLKADEDFKGIYQALSSYDAIVPGDIIVVENAVSDYAYFGELNANLAIRSGAVAALIGGKTRDSSDVQRLGFPVFSTGYTCQDVRKRATVESMNQPIMFFGVSVYPNDLIFADKEGVVIIPQAIESSLITQALASAANEKRLLVDIAQGISVDELTDKYGFF